MTINTDTILLICALYFFFRGWQKGLLRSILGPISLVIGAIASYFYYAKTNNILLALIIGILGPFLLDIGLSLLLRLKRTAEDKRPPLFSAGRVMGGIFSLLWRGTLVMLTLVLIVLAPIKIAAYQNMQKNITSSWSYQFINQWLDHKLPLEPSSFKKLTTIMEKPESFQELQKSDSFQSLTENPHFIALIKDPSIRQDFEERNIANLLANPHMQELLKDPKILHKIMDINKLLQSSGPSNTDASLHFPIQN